MNENLEKFNELVEIARIEYQDELSKNSRLEEKVSKFLMVLSIIIIAFIYLILSSQTWDFLLKKHILIQSVYIFLCVWFIFETLICISYCLKTFKLNAFKRYELGKNLEDLTFDESQNLISMKWQVYKTYKDSLSFNILILKEKTKNIAYALSSLLRCSILFTIITFISFIGYVELAYAKTNPSQKTKQTITIGSA
jgi:hypothetical protein